MPQEGYLLFPIFVPNQQYWVVQFNAGNPTKSLIINAVMIEGKRAEVRNAKRDLKRAEFIKTIRLLEAYGQHDYAAKFPTMMKTQFQIIGRTDNITTLRLLIFVVILLSLTQQRL
jgi:hypothetical protein